MEEILANIEQQLKTCQIFGASSRQEEVDPVESLPGFVSVIKINGKPIPPPVMTQQRRHEMRQLRCAAVEREQELASRRRMKLLEKVQNIVNGIEEWRTSSQASQNDVTMTTEEHTDTYLAASSHEVAPVSSTGDPDENMNSLKLVELCTGDSSDLHEDTSSRVVESVQGSTSSSSDASLLNRTVIAASGFSPKKLGVESKKQESLSEEQLQMASSELNVSPQSVSLIQNSTSKASSTLQTTQDMTSLKLSVDAPESHCGSQALTSGIKLACSWSKEVKKAPEASELDMGETFPWSGLHLMPSIGFVQDSMDDLEPFGEKESYLSLLGEYSSLPVPSRSSHFFSDVTEVPSSTPVDSASLAQTEKSLENNVKSGVKSEKSPNVLLPLKDDPSMFISSCSTLMTNTAEQSCTLPSSLRTISAASTLQDIDDPWNTLVETPVPYEEDLEPQDNINVPRGTPVGQEDIVKVNPTSATSFVKASPNTVSSDNEISSPEKRVRRNSYTLDHPSPALLNAQARNEAPHANLEGSERESSVRRSLELTHNDAEEQKSEIKVDTFEDQRLDHQEEPSEEEFIHLQLQYFEEMRCQMEQQQRQQLQQLLIEQQQAQMALQQEMSQLEKRFRQRQGQGGGTGQAMEGARRASRASREDMPGIVGAGSEACGNDSASLTSTSMSSKKSSPASFLGSAGYSPSTETSLKHTSPSVITSASPTAKSTGTAGDGVKTDPFYLGGITRSPGEGENVTASPLMIRSPYNKQLNSPTLKKNLDRVSAVVKGYLTRRIFQSHKVQAIIKTIKDSAAFADKFIAETPFKKGNMSMQDMVLAERVLAQVRAAQYDLHDVFFGQSVAQRMEVIQQSRKLKNEENQKKKTSPVEDRFPSRPLSAATIKALERKRKAREAEARLFGQRRSPPKGAVTSRSRPVSAAEGRVLKPLISQRSPMRPASANTYRPSKHGIIIHQDALKSKDPKKLNQDPGRSKVNNRQVPGNSKQSAGSKVRSPVMGKTKGVRRSLYPIANPLRKTARRTPEDVRK